MVVVSGKCDCCNKYNSECMVFKKRVLWYFVIEVKLCQSCMSRAFKLLNKGK